MRGSCFTGGQATGLPDTASPAISSRSTAWARPDSPSSCCPWVATAGPTRGRAPQAAGRPPRRAGRRRNAL